MVKKSKVGVNCFIHISLFIIQVYSNTTRKVLKTEKDTGTVIHMEMWSNVQSHEIL